MGLPPSAGREHVTPRHACLSAAGAERTGVWQPRDNMLCRHRCQAGAYPADKPNRACAHAHCSHRMQPAATVSLLAPACRHSQEGWPASMYGVSKLLESMYTRVLAQQLPKVMVNAVHPGERGQPRAGTKRRSCRRAPPAERSLPLCAVAVDTCSHAQVSSSTSPGWHRRQTTMCPRNLPYLPDHAPCSVCTPPPQATAPPT